MKPVSLKQYFIGLSKDSLIYGFGNAILKILALLTAPIFTRVFLPADYGIINLITSITYFLSLLMIFGMDAATSVSYYQYGKEKKTIVSTAFWFLVIWGILLVGLASLFSKQFSSLSFHINSYYLLFLIAFATAFFTLLVSFAKLIFRLEFQAKTFAFIAIFQAIISMTLMIILVVVLKYGLAGYLGGTLIGTFASFILAFGYILYRKTIIIKFNLARFKEMLAYGVMMVPTALSFYVFDLSDRYFINHYWNLTELGLYSIAINIASLLTFFSIALGQAWTPYVLKLYYKSKKIFDQFVPRIFIYYLVLFFSLALFVTIFGQEILRIFTTPRYYDSFRAIGPMALAFTFGATLQITVLGMTIARKTKFMAFYAGMTALINIGFNFLLIPKLGMVGAAWATAISYFFLTVSYLFTSQKFIYLKLPWQKIFKLVLLSVTLIIFAPYLWQTNFYSNLAIKLAELIIFCFLLYFLGIIERQEITSLKEVLKTFRIRR